MKYTKEMLEIMKAIVTTTDLQDGGYLLPKQARAFILMAIDSVDLLPLTRTVIMPSNTYQMDKIGIGRRLMRGMGETEDMSPYTQKPLFGKLELVSKKYALPWEIGEDALLENIEGQGLATRISKLMATAMGLDTEDLAVHGWDGTPAPTAAINSSGGISDTDATIPYDTLVNVFPRDSEAGWIKIENENIFYTKNNTTLSQFEDCTRGENDTTAASHSDSVAITWTKHPLIGVDDGWMRLITENSGSIHTVDGTSIASGHLDKGHFFALYNALPNKYKRGAQKTGLRWIMSTLTKSKWVEYLTNRATAAGDAALVGKELYPLGMPIIDVGVWPDYRIMLTNPKNLIVGIRSRVKMQKAVKDKAAISTDTRYYQGTIREDFQIEEYDAIAKCDEFDFSWA